MTIGEKIQKLKKERNAVILAHNYQVAEVQDIADFVGDSYGLSAEAAKTEADVIVFCGVYFMAETAKILSPEKTVIIPDKDAGCPLANMIDVESLTTLKKDHPNATVLCYVNSSAAVKAECDICCTSANAVRVVEGLGGDEHIIFAPDKHLAHYVATETKRKFINWPGYCPTHIKITPEDISRARIAHPDAVVLVHPECRSDVIGCADEAFSTEGMCRYVKRANAREFIIGTEVGILHRLTKENPGKKFYPASERAVCPNMKRITLEKVLWALEEMSYRVEVPSEVSARARKSIDRMLEFKAVG